MVTLTINDTVITVPEGTTILKACNIAGHPVPSLCYWEGLNEIGACRICIVEVEGVDHLVPACIDPVQEGMVVRTNSPRVRVARRTNLQLILSQHNCECPTCVRNGNCMLQRIAYELNVHDNPFPKDLPAFDWDMTSPLIRDASKCIKCMRCIQVCDKITSLNIWDLAGTGSRVTVNVSHNRTIGEADCSYCGQCITHCPTGALQARDDTNKVLDALADPDIVTVVQVAPSVRVSWAEELGMDAEVFSTPKMVGVLKEIGFDYVFDTNFGADLTIMEEATEFAERFTHRDQYKWPMFTSCCPGWVRFLKSNYPEMTDNLSSAKSPMQMFGAVCKSYFAKKAGIDPHKICMISVMPCVAKKAECALEPMRDACGDPDVDIVITTREFTRMIRADHIQIDNIEDAEFDSPLGESTGAAVIFGTTGGVMDAALRTAYYFITGENPDADDFTEVRDTQFGEGRQATFNIPGAGEVRIAVASGLGHARKLLDAIKAGKASYDFVEIMACPGGCVGGGGQPIVDGIDLNVYRGASLWHIDRNMDIRFSHENPEIQALYKDYLGKPCGDKAHHLLHTNHHDWQMPQHVSDK
ncbi:MAG: [FeFe] hydrogenase, group A [Peptococcaceae bacterium]|nr:[FeFe] hydrogenase, group A [Peptococcaceae bacterium]